MDTTPLAAELAAIAARHPAAQPFVQQALLVRPEFDTRAPLIVAAAAAAGLGLFHAVALLSKLQMAERPPSVGAFGRPAWQRFLERARAPLGPLIGSLQVAELELLVIEQHALACEELDMAQVEELARRHERETSMLAATETGKRADFLRDKRAWLLDEIRLDQLHALRQQVVAELESTRMQYLQIAGRAAVELVEAAHRVALLRYRVVLDDPTLTREELNLRLRDDLRDPDESARLVPIEPELRRALLNSETGMQSEHDLMLLLQALRDAGRLQPASRDEQREAEVEFRRLARLIHPDALARHPQYASIAPQNERRLREIWHLASATHGVRVQLSRDKLLNYLEHLREWKEEVLRILRDISFPMPSLLLHGDTLDARHADLQRAMEDVQRHLRAVHDEIYDLENDPLHEEYRRVIAMTEQERAAERERMKALAEAWNAEARQLAAQLEARDSSRGAAQPPGERRGGESPAQREQRP